MCTLSARYFLKLRRCGCRFKRQKLKHDLQFKKGERRNHRLYSQFRNLNFHPYLRYSYSTRSTAGPNNFTSAISVCLYFQFHHPAQAIIIHGTNIYWTDSHVQGSVLGIKSLALFILNILTKILLILVRFLTSCLSCFR